MECLSGSRAAAPPSRIVACDNPYWVLSGAKTFRISIKDTLLVEMEQKFSKGKFEKGGQSETYQTQW